MVVFFPTYSLYYSAQAAITNAAGLSLSEINNRNLFLTAPEAMKSKMKMPAVPCEISFPGFVTAVLT